MIKKFINFFNILLVLTKSKYYNFLTLDCTIHSSNQLLEENILEHKISKKIGPGSSILFASGRMSLFAILKTLNLNKSDEVLILGFTCSVVVNAVIKSNATPKYYDVDPKNFGSNLLNIKKAINNNTKVIIIQHSFGIPCDAEEIYKYTKANQIFLIEDCALTFCSKISNVNVGNFSDAAFFSTDHTKPLNTYIGGFVYTRNEHLYKKIKNIQLGSKNMSKNLSQSMFKSYLTELNFKNSQKYILIINYFKNIKYRIIKKSFFLNEDYTSNSSNYFYPYPSNFPKLFYNILDNNLENWDLTSKNRKEVLKLYLSYFDKYNLRHLIPSVYFNSNLEIIPLRFVFFIEDNFNLIRHLKKIIDINSFWFTKPIIATNEPLKNFNYVEGSCINSEFLSKNIINLPCAISIDDAKYIINHIDLYFKKYYNETNFSK